MRAERTELPARAHAGTRKNPSDTSAPKSKTVIQAVRDVISISPTLFAARRSSGNQMVGAIGGYRVKRIFGGISRNVFQATAWGKSPRSRIRAAAGATRVAFAWCLACGTFP